MRTTRRTWIVAAFTDSFLFLDAYGTPPRTTQVTDRISSTNVTLAINRTGKRFPENRDEISARTRHGTLLVSGQIRFEGDPRDECASGSGCTSSGSRHRSNRSGGR